MTDKLDKYASPVARGRAIGRRRGRTEVLPMVPDADLNGREVLGRVRDVLARRWRTALAVFIVIVGGVGLGAGLRDPLYRATGLLEIRSAPGDAPSVDSLLEVRRVSDEALQTAVGMLQSAALAERVLDKLDLSADPLFNPSAKAGRSVTRQALVNQLRQHLIIDPQQGRLVAVHYDAADPALAARVVNGVIDSYLEWRLEDASGTAKWLSAQIADTQAQLQASEQRLQAYVRSNGLQIIETGKGESTNLVNDRLRQLHTQLADLQVERYEKQSLFENASGGRIVDDPIIQNLTVRLAELQREHASLSATFLDDYPKVQQLKQQITQVQASIDQQVQIARKRLESSYQAALRRESLLQGALAEQQKTAVALTGDLAGYETLKREVLTNQQLYAALDQKLKDVTIATGLRATNMGVVDRASAAAASSLKFPLAVSLSLAACIGLLLGLGIVFVQEQADSSVRSVSEVGAHLGMPVMAVIPAIDTPRSENGLETINGPGRAQTVLAEAFAALRASVILNHDGPAPRTLLVTSARTGEGKTTVAVNLALSLARLSERVLLIDFDLRRPAVSRRLNLERGPGLAECLTGGAAWRSLLQTGPVSCLDVLAAGSASPSGVADMAMSPRLRQLLTEAADEYDFVIVDSSPLLVSPADVRTLAALVDGTLLTVRSGITPREVVRAAWTQLRRPLGIVLNGASARDTPAYGYPYTEDVETLARSASFGDGSVPCA